MAEATSATDFCTMVQGIQTAQEYHELLMTHDISGEILHHLTTCPVCAAYSEGLETQFFNSLSEDFKKKLERQVREVMDHKPPPDSDSETQH